ncbi:MAG: hypothetical protein A2341_04965 [Deltaproteobacteria bacterium RIFOXYB12_FULL_58_9]|nr:MAG: hypothetical protein A2341_04965 [Deltaproteobacteria bacterium RIFOXYB12_FULL_58_9]
MSQLSPGVSIVVPVHNGEESVEETMFAIDALEWPRDLEIIVVDDGSVDGSSELLEQWKGNHSLTLLRCPGIGAAAALNCGLKHARYEWLAQIDQDVAPHPSWLSNLVLAMDNNERVVAAQGVFQADPRDGWIGAACALDLRLRYSSNKPPDHVCTGNTIYRTEALRSIGGFDEELGYGYDNDVSYRLQAAGTLHRVDDAMATHRWPATLGRYLAREYGLGYGRLDLIRKHPRRWHGDRISGLGMILHAAIMALSLFASPLLLGASLMGWNTGIAVAVWTVMLLALASERLAAGITGIILFGKPVGLLFPLLHLARDAAWSIAIVVWSVRTILRIDSLPSHSMQRRTKERKGEEPFAGKGYTGR